MEGQTTAGKGPKRRWLPPPETRRSGRRSPPLPPLKRLRPPEREEGEESFPYGLPRVKEGRRSPERGEEEEAEADLPLRKESESARLLEI